MTPEIRGLTEQDVLDQINLEHDRRELRTIIIALVGAMAGLIGAVIAVVV